MNFSERLKLLQKQSGLSKKQIYTAVNSSRTMYYHYENGDIEPTIGILISLADLFNVSTDYLLGRTNNPSMNK